MVEGVCMVIKSMSQFLKSEDKFSGITIHYVDGEYDNGEIIFQAKCPVDQDDTIKTLSSKIHKLEHKHYPVIVGQILKNLYQVY